MKKRRLITIIIAFFLVSISYGYKDIHYPFKFLPPESWITDIIIILGILIIVYELKSIERENDCKK